jgi:hypothetical protein
MAHYQELNQALAEVLRSHGVATEDADGWVTCPESKRRLRAAVVSVRPNQAFVSAQVDVHLLLWPGRILIESFGGFGQSAEEAWRDGLKNFLNSSLHVLLAAFLTPGRPDELITRETWAISGRPRQVTVGSMVVRGKPPAGWPELEFFHEFQRELSSHEVSDGTHWMRLYYAQSEGRPLATEVLLDNREWPAMQEAMTRAHWPQGADFFSLRVFLVVEGGPDLSQAVMWLAQNPRLDEAGQVALLEFHGLPHALSDRIVTLVPLAFGRRLLAGFPVTLPEVAVIRSQDGAERELRFNGDPMFREACSGAGRLRLRHAHPRGVLGAGDAQRRGSRLQPGPSGRQPARGSGLLAAGAVLGRLGWRWLNLRLISASSACGATGAALRRADPRAG